MSSRSTKYHHSRRDQINLISMPSIVAYSHCVKEKKSYHMSSLSEVCGQCYRDSIKECLPAYIPIPDFSKINRELEKLKKQEEAVKAQQDTDKKLIAEAQERLQVSRSKMRRLRKQRKLLKQKEADVFEAGQEDAEELDRLEKRERFNQELASTNPEAPAEAAVINWSCF
jgi:hypothetical protein